MLPKEVYPLECHFPSLGPPPTHPPPHPTPPLPHDHNAGPNPVTTDKSHCFLAHYIHWVCYLLPFASITPMRFRLQSLSLFSFNKDWWSVGCKTNIFFPKADLLFFSLFCLYKYWCLLRTEGCAPLTPAWQIILRVDVSVFCLSGVNHEDTVVYWSSTAGFRAAGVSLKCIQDELSYENKNAVSQWRKRRKAAGEEAQKQHW